MYRTIRNLLILALVSLISTSTSNALLAQGTGYGVAGGDLYSLNLSNGTAALVTNTLAFSNTNGLATDGDNNILYYSQQDTYNIGYYDLTLASSGTVGNLAAVNTNLTRPEGLRGAGWYNGGYYFIDMETDDLYRADLSKTGISSVTKIADIANTIRPLRWATWSSTSRACSMRVSSTAFVSRPTT